MRHKTKWFHAAILIGFINRTLFGAVEGFDESFDGNGSYSTTTGELSGLDNPGWRFETAAGIGVLDGIGYSFDVGSFPVNDSDTWWRSVPGYGSFREVVHVSDLDMGFYSEGGIGTGAPRSVLAMRHYFRGAPTQNSLDVYFAGDFPGGTVNNAVYLAWYGIVPRVSNFELGLEFDQSSKEIWTWLDSPETGRIMTGPRKISASPVDDFINTELYLGKSMDGKLSGRIDHWSVVPLPDIRGDINDDGRLDIADADLLSRIIQRGDDDAVADLTRNGKADQNDLGLWIHFHRFSYFGDANLDGQFNSQDLTIVFQAGEYEDLVDDNSGWADGDWNADGEFSSSDLVVAFQDGGYEKGPRPVVASVPEPQSVAFLAAVAAAIYRVKRNRGRQERVSDRRTVYCEYCPPDSE